uniref:Uncharacterized protein n=1 Tax=Romanomermis culicivorax TaxID=13658 RepID=A0A915I021_ROMCU
MLLHQPETLTKEDIMNISNKTLKNIPEASIADAKTSMDVILLAVDPCIYLVMPTALPSPSMIAAVATARYISTVHLLQQYIPDSQSSSLAATLKAYVFPAPLPHILFPEHHWRDYPLSLHSQTTTILMPAHITTTPALQPTPPVPTAQIVAQSVPQPISAQQMLSVEMDIQQ